MRLEDHLLVKGVHNQSFSSEVPQKFLKSGRKRELLKTCLDKENKIKISSKSKMLEQDPKAGNKNLKNADNRKGASSNSASRKQSRKGEKPVQLTPTMQNSGFGLTHWLCTNPVCRAMLSLEYAFCRRCSCCICHRFDDNKDPSLWLVCESESAEQDSCGLSCHIECALEKEKLGVVKLGQHKQLDGSYCCASCGKVSGILECWKKQLVTAKDARRVDELWYRVCLSYKLLDNTSSFKELHEIVTEAKTTLEAELGESARTNRGIFSRLDIAPDVHELCSKAIDKAEEWLAKVPGSTPGCTVVSLPAACKFEFEEATSSSLVIVLIEIPPLTDSIKEYKLWYCRSREEIFPEEPVSVFPGEKRRITVEHLQPCTEYTFRIMSCTEFGVLGHSEAKHYTKSIEIPTKDPSSESGEKENPMMEGSFTDGKELNSSGFKVQDLGKVLHMPWTQEQGNLEGFCSADIEQCESPKVHKSLPVSRNLDLNVASVPDLNEDVIPPLESSDNDFTLERGIGPDDDAASHGIEKNGLAGSNGSGPSDDSRAWAPTQNGDVPAVDSSLLETGKKRGSSALDETHDCDSTLISRSPLHLSGGLGSGSLDESFEYCVKVIRSLECEGYMKQEFRLKLLTWFSLRSTEQERRVVNTFIKTLKDDPQSLAGQLVDSFGDIISYKKPRNGFASIPS